MGRSVALSTHHAHALFHCIIQVPQCTRKASQVMIACNTPEKVELQEEPLSGRAAGATTTGVHTTEDKETESKTEEKAEGKNAEAPDKHVEDVLIKDTHGESKSLQVEPEAEQ